MTMQIDIKELIPFMKDGYVAMDKDGDWYWFEQYTLCIKYIGDVFFPYLCMYRRKGLLK